MTLLFNYHSDVLISRLFSPKTILIINYTACTKFYSLLPNKNTTLYISTAPS